MSDRPDPAAVVADADVLAADLLVGGAARAALDVVRSHSWVTLVASDPLLDDAEAVIATLADDRLAGDWREKAETLVRRVEHPEHDHPALASAMHGRAAHVLSYDESLTSARTGASVRKFVATSIKRPDAFVGQFDAESLYEAVEGGSYGGPDRDPRA